VDEVKISEVYSLIDYIYDINAEIRDKAFQNKDSQLWNLYEVGHNTQLALAAYVVALQSHGDT
tara:strand:+ start:172 stop:360 length:189 start_codon:yes stop_codon:yes gene_type:complete